ncbi:MAG TPA: hypothetical protein VGM88_22350 [Kofleriaceae bacterium]|jgi:hypothetical protein
MTTSQAVLGWAVAAAAAVGAVGCTHAGGKVPVDNPAMAYQAPDIDDITGIDSDADSDKDSTSAEAPAAPAPAATPAAATPKAATPAPKAGATPAPKATTPAPAPKK